MAILGAVVRFDVSSDAQDEARERLLADPRVTGGPGALGVMAMTFEGATTEATEWLEDISRWPGIALVHPVFHDFEDELSAPAADAAGAPE